MHPKKRWTPQEREMLFRKAHGKIGHARYLEKLAAFFIPPPQARNLLELPATDALWPRSRPPLTQQRWISSRLPAVRAIYPEDGYMSARHMLAQVQTLLDAQDCAVYWGDWDRASSSHCCGAYRAARHTRIRADYDFALHQSDDIWFFTADGSCTLHWTILKTATWAGTCGCCNIPIRHTQHEQTI